MSISNGVSAQEYNRERLRGNIRTINQGGLVPIDSAAILRTKAEAAARRDSLYYNFIDSIGRAEYKLYNETAIEVRDSLRKVIAQRVKRDSAIVMHGDSIAPDGRRIRLNKRGEERKPFISDSMGLSKVCWLSLPLPGFGQIYNKQYWKLGVLYPVVGASVGMFVYENKQYKPFKKQYDQYLIDHGYMRTPELDAIQTELIKHNTRQQIYAGVAIATYLYFIGDAAINYTTNEVSRVKKATTLSTIFPGAGQVFNKSYWRVPIVLGGLASTIYTIDWNNRGYQRFKTAYALRVDYDKNPEKYPQGAADEFRGAYSATFLKNLKDSYRRNRDLCIILTAGVYLLNILDAHVDAHLQDYDISDDLTMNLEPYFDYTTVGTQPVYGVNMSFKF
ncbi:MAG: DUF5683 domain-containing protein [Alistipes sp.]|nr:hypothetical protein [Alistipes sp.]MEE1148182.1 DUF5683 domain-containing protein [Alistipes sp.]